MVGFGLSENATVKETLNFERLSECMIGICLNNLILIQYELCLIVDTHGRIQATIKLELS